MTAKEYMKQAQRLLRRIDRKQKEPDALRQKLSFPKSPAYSDFPNPYRRNLTPWKAAFLRSYPWRKK